MTPNVLWTEHVSITTVDLHVKMLVDRMLNARRGTMEPSVLVHQDMLEILSQHADLHAGPVVDFQDLEDT